MIIEGKCDFCGNELNGPSWTRVCQPTYPFHRNPGGKYRYCSQDCYDIQQRPGQIAGGRLGEKEREKE